MTTIEAREKMKDRNISYLSRVLNVSYMKLRRWFLGNESALSLIEVRELVEYLRGNK